MDDGDLLGLLAAEAPDPRPGLADAVIARGRRARARRRWKAAAGGLALAAAVTVAVPVVLHQTGGTQTDSSAAKPATGPLKDQEMAEPYAREQPAPVSAVPDDLAVVYETAIDAFLAGRAGAELKSVSPLRILDRFCPLRGKCTERPLDPGLRRELSARLPWVRFVRDDGAEYLVEPLRLGEARIDGEKARVAISGTLLSLELRQGRWQVVDGS
ncbi:hypothetical protein [Actinocorallia libanotica]|uniref:Mce-associated membrane protein n=1 Tax=Actinocorallia libanotica TaxID=46162 RepID=A0ABP4CLA2_9ACTN